MTRRIVLLCAITLAACASGDSDDGGSAPFTGGTTGGSAGMNVAGAGAGGTSSGGVGGVQASGGASGASGGIGVSGAGGISGVGGAAAVGGVAGIGGAAGTMTETGGMTGGSAGTGDTGPVEPIIPEIDGECPSFSEGTNTVSLMGISATVIAGAKSAGTGPLLFYFYGTFKAGGVGTLPQSIKDDIVASGGMVFAPQSALNTGGDCSGTGTFGIDDFKVADQVVACAVKNYGIDPKRIYATGCSAGGLTTGCMGIMRSNYMAAVAPNSGGVTIGYGDLQNPSHMPNAITMNGGSGDNVIVNFGETSEGYDNYVLKYGGFAVNCIHSSGHCGAPSALYEFAWQFLKDHPFGTKPSPYAGGLPSEAHDSCQIFEMTEMAPLGGY
jgi:hypothetical protein